MAKDIRGVHGLEPGMEIFANFGVPVRSVPGTIGMPSLSERKRSDIFWIIGVPFRSRNGERSDIFSIFRVPFRERERSGLIF